MEGLDKKLDSQRKGYSKSLVLFFPSFLLIRRVIFAVAVFGMSELLAFQLLILIGSAMINAVYLLAL